MMLNVITLEEAKKLLLSEFGEIEEAEAVPLLKAAGRILSEDIISKENIPAADRSMVDGFAVTADDTFGATEAIPALLKLKGEIEMGAYCGEPLHKGECFKISTGGFMPEGSDCAVMREYTDTLPDGTVCVMKPVSPGAHLAFCGDDMKKGEVVLKKGSRLTPCRIGALGAIGERKVNVKRKIKVGVFSTGDEICDINEKTALGQMRDVNRYVLLSLLKDFPFEGIDYGIIKDDKNAVKEAVLKALESCDTVVFSGGTSAGNKDFAVEVLEDLGSVLWHGLAVKPGKPTLCGKVFGKPVLVLPGHPAAAYLIWQVLGEFIMRILSGEDEDKITAPAVLSEQVSANDGRELLLPVTLMQGEAAPIRTKSGLISRLSSADGYISVPRNCEGLHKGEKVSVTLFKKG